MNWFSAIWMVLAFFSCKASASQSAYETHNDSELLKIEEKSGMTGKALTTTIHIYAGRLEVFNKVLSSTKKFNSQLRSRDYESLSLTYDEIRMANHYSVRRPAIDKILARFD